MIPSQGVWLVCFTDTKPHHAWKWMTCPGFRHVFSMRYDHEQRKWVFVEWGNGILFVETMSWEEGYAILQEVHRQGGSCLAFATRDQPLSRPQFWRTVIRPPFYCITAITGLLNVRCLAVTPRQLWCALRKRGGLVIFRGSQEADGPHERNIWQTRDGKTG